MSTQGSALPVGRSFLLKAWLVVAAWVIAAATAIALGLALGDNGAGSQVRSPEVRPSPVAQFAPGAGSHQPIVVDGKVCGQCA
jgi:hypothetical protein